MLSTNASFEQLYSTINDSFNIISLSGPARSSGSLVYGKPRQYRHPVFGSHLVLIWELGVPGFHTKQNKLGVTNSKLNFFFSSSSPHKYIIAKHGGVHMTKRLGRRCSSVASRILVAICLMQVVVSITRMLSTRMTLCQR